jgi:hypothetical protein
VHTRTPPSAHGAAVLPFFPGRRVPIRCRWYGAPIRLLMIYLTLRFDLIFVVPRVRSRLRNPRYRWPIWSPPAYPGRPACCCYSMPLLGPSPLPVLLPRTSALPCRLHRRRPDGSTRLQPRRPLQSAYSRCCCHGGTGDGVAAALGGMRWCYLP